MRMILAFYRLCKVNENKTLRMIATSAIDNGTSSVRSMEYLPLLLSLATVVNILTPATHSLIKSFYV